MSIIQTWAKKNNITPQAVLELTQLLTATNNTAANTDSDGRLESEVTPEILIAAGSVGISLFRNNSGALKNPETGRFVRFGLGNISAKWSSHCKSSDYIGWRTVDGIAQFVAFEFKKPGWKYTGTPREKAQKKFIDAVNIAGGYAKFITRGEDV